MPIIKGPGEESDLVNAAVDDAANRLKAAGIRVKVNTRRGKGNGGARGGCPHFMHGRSRMTIWYRPSHSYYAGTEHVEFSPTRQIDCTQREAP